MDSNTLVPRSLIRQECHSSIDTILKDLKPCLRRINNALATHADEYQLLQRIFYKNKNQHRGALFWRRVAEMRRFSERLNNANISLALEEVRNSFFGPDVKQNSKILKGAWTHAPNTNSVRDSVNHLHDCETLLQKEKLLQAYQSFTLAMQGGAFVQLLLILAAIASRLRILSVEIGEAVSMSSSLMARFLMLDIELPTDRGRGSPAALTPLPAVTEDDRNGRLVDMRTTTNEQDPSLVQQAISRVNIKRRSEPVHRDKMQAKHTKKVKRAINEIDEIFSNMD